MQIQSWALAFEWKLTVILVENVHRTPSSVIQVGINCDLFASHFLVFESTFVGFLAQILIVHNMPDAIRKGIGLMKLTPISHRMQVSMFSSSM